MPAWCQHFDFSLDQQGWSLTWPDRPNYGTYEIGTGWKTRRINNADRLYLWKSFSQLTRVTWIAFTYTATGTTPPNALLTLGHHNGAFLNTKYGPAGVDGNSHEYSWTGSMDVDAIGFHIILTPGTGHILSAEVEGEGINPFVPSIELTPAGGGETVWVYLASINGNPSQTDFLTSLSTPLAIDRYAVDPLTKTLWFHVVQGWVQVGASDRTGDTILKPDGCNWIEDGTYMGADRLIVPAPDSARRTLNLNFADILSCLSNGVANATSDYPLGNVPWPVSGIPQFTQLPISIQQICSETLPGVSTRSEIHGLGYYVGSGDPYNNPPVHPGVDFFAPSGSNVYSIGANGIVVGIGIGRGQNPDGSLGSFATRSVARWGSAVVTENNDNIGFSIIIRYGHLYILYGHLKEIDFAIYVGSQIEVGTVLGKIGTFPNSEPHLHIEIRSWGANLANGTLVQVPDDVNGGYKNNSQGILHINPPSSDRANNVYDIMQFFNSAVALTTETSTTLTAEIIGVSKDIENGDSVTFQNGTTPVTCTSGSFPILSYFTTGTAQIGDYRGFVLLVPSVTTPFDPTAVTAAP